MQEYLRLRDKLRFARAAIEEGFGCFLFLCRDDAQRRFACNYLSLNPKNLRKEFPGIAAHIQLDTGDSPMDAGGWSGYVRVYAPEEMVEQVRTFFQVTDKLRGF